MKNINSLSAEAIHGLKNNEDVRLFRLHLLEENQQKIEENQLKILQKIESLEKNLESQYNSELKKHDKRITLLEECCNNYTKFKWIIIGEAVAIVTIIVRSSLGL